MTPKLPEETVLNNDKTFALADSPGINGRPLFTLSCLLMDHLTPFSLYLQEASPDLRRQQIIWSPNLQLVLLVLLENFCCNRHILYIKPPLEEAFRSFTSVKILCYQCFMTSC